MIANLMNLFISTQLQLYVFFLDPSRNTVRAPLIETGTHRFFGCNGI